MKICYVGWAQSIHMQRIAGWFAQRGHEISLITDQPAHLENIDVFDISHALDKRPRFARYAHLSFNNRHVRLLKDVFRIRGLIRKINPDILHLQTLYYPSCLGSFAPFKPLVITPWNGDIVWTPNRTSFHKMIVKHALRKADFISTNSQAMWQNCVNLGLAENKLKMIQWTGVDLRKFRPRAKDQKLLEKLKLTASSPIVLSTRSLGDIYNIDIIVRAIPTVLHDIPDARFVFVWFAGDKFQEIERLIDDLGVRHAVCLAGKVDHDEMPAYFNISDVFVSVSSCDTTPTSLLESMASGTPPVTAFLKPVNETIKDGWNGLIVPQRDPQSTGDAILGLLKNENLRQVFATRNLSIVKEIADHEREMSKMEDLYVSLLSKRTRFQRGLEA